MVFKAHNFTIENEMEWDQFVIGTESYGGTFLQTRKFINYHNPTRFKDCSVIIRDEKGTLAAVILGCENSSSGKRAFYSHNGTSFGGLIVRKKYFNTEDMMGIINELQIFLKSSGYEYARIKLVPQLFSEGEADLLIYLFKYFEWHDFIELSAYVDLNSVEDLENLLNRNKRRNVRHYASMNTEMKELNSYDEIQEFHRILSVNLQKYNATPVHSVQELIDLKFNRFQNTIYFYGLYIEGVMVCAGMFFLFDNVKVLHAQNIVSDLNSENAGATALFYFKAMALAKDIFKVNKLSWGISTENFGKIVNLALIQNKESYGSRYALNYTVEKLI